MKKNSKILIIVLACILFVSCEDGSKYGNLVKEHDKMLQEQIKLRNEAKDVNGYFISIIKYDSCEYLISGVGNSQMITHKGNCKNKHN